MTQETRAGRETPRDERGTSWISAMIGMLAALGAALLLSGVVAIVVSLVVALLGAGGGSATGAGVSSLVGVLATLFLAYLVGGYAAGRMAGRMGTRHGLLAALLGVAVTVFLVLVGAIAGFGVADNLSGVVLPDVPEGGQQGLGALLALSVVAGVLVLVTPFVGGLLGGPWGARTGRRRP